jgi:hypothetical protein
MKSAAAVRPPTKAQKTKQPTTPISPLVLDYQRYFLAPESTPASFRVLDLTDGASFSYTSHT